MISYAKLISRIRSTFDDAGTIGNGNLKNLSSSTCLRAGVDEALRLGPAVSGALWPEAGPGGAYVGSQHILESLNDGICTWASSHDAQYFYEPFRFKPERFPGRALDGERVVITEATILLYQLPNVSSHPTFFPTTIAMIAHAADSANPRQLGSQRLPGHWPTQLHGQNAGVADAQSGTPAHRVATEFVWVDDMDCCGTCMGRRRERTEESQITDIFSSISVGLP